MNFNLGFIGGGNMSTAIIQGILKKGEHPPDKVWVSGPHIENLQHWKEMGTNVTTKNIEVFTKCDIVFLGIKPMVLAQVMQQCRSELPNKLPLNKTLTVVSMLAGVNIAKLNQELHRLSTQPIHIVRIMPNTPITVGEGACLYTPADGVDGYSFTENCKRIVKVLSSSSVCEQVSEQLMDSLGVLTACGPAFIYMIIEALADGAVKQGVPREMAQRFAAQMVVGSGKMVLQTGKHPGLLKDEVCSPGGSTISGVAALENGNLRATLINAIEASTVKTLSMLKK